MEEVNVAKHWLLIQDQIQLTWMYKWTHRVGQFFLSLFQLEEDPIYHPLFTTYTIPIHSIQ